MIILLDDGEFFIEAFAGFRDAWRSPGRLVQRRENGYKLPVGLVKEDVKGCWYAYLLVFKDKDRPVTERIISGVC